MCVCFFLYAFALSCSIYNHMTSCNMLYCLGVWALTESLTLYYQAFPLTSFISCFSYYCSVDFDVNKYCLTWLDLTIVVVDMSAGERTEGLIRRVVCAVVTLQMVWRQMSLPYLIMEIMRTDSVFPSTAQKNGHEKGTVFFPALSCNMYPC